MGKRIESAASPVSPIAMNTSAIHANALHASVKVHSTLRRLFLLRSLAIAGQLLAIAVAMLIFDMPLPLPALAAVVAL